MQKLFKNASLVDIENQTVKLVDILVVDEKIKEISSKIEENDFEEVVDLQKNFVMPSFVNVFCDSLKAFEKSYEISSNFDNMAKKKIANLFLIKNLLAGAVFVNDVSVENTFKSKVLEDLENLDEKKLNFLSDDVSKNKNLLFMKVGQTLEELGFIDQTYKKTLSQFLEDFGFLDRNAVLVGGNCLEKDELQLLKEYDCKVVVLPNEDGREGRRQTNLTTLKHLEFEIGVGSGHIFEVDFFAFCRQLIASQRSMFEDRKCIDEQKALSLVLYEGAKILGFENSIAEGCYANFIVVKNEVSLYQNPLQTLVWEKSKKDVLLSVFKGIILQENGKILMKNLPDYDTIIVDIKKSLF